MKILTLDIELAWSAGFLDGEGNFCAPNESAGRIKRRFKIQACQVDREVLDRLEVALGGSVRGPYGPYSGNRQPYYQWCVYGPAAKEAFALLEPYLGSVKLEQGKRALEIAE